MPSIWKNVRWKLRYVNYVHLLVILDKSLSLSNTLIDLTKDLNDDLYMKIKISAL